jgi:pyruvate/2-oxoglutarate/acetoin dehydrogenase E1 component
VGRDAGRLVANNLFNDLHCGPSVLGVPEIPAPFAAAMESEWVPSRAKITERVLSMVTPAREPQSA